MIKKWIFLITFFSLSFLDGFTQDIDNSNFEFDKNERSVSWIRVFEPEQEIDFKTLKEYFINNKILSLSSETENSLRGEFIKRPIDIQKYGYARMKTPMFLLDVEQIFNVFIEYKEGRYRVILTELGYIDNGVLTDLAYQAFVGNTLTTAKGNIVSYNGDFSFTNKNEIRKRLTLPFEILDKFYSDILQFKEIKKVDSDW